MDVAKIRAKIKELRTLADELEAVLPPAVMPEVFEEDVVIVVEEDILPAEPMATAPVFAPARNEDFEREIHEAIGKILGA